MTPIDEQLFELDVVANNRELVPAFERLFESEGRDPARFYASVKRLADLPKDARREKLAAPPSSDQ